MSFGEELKRERELREISLREVSESTKISLRYLEALESNDFENLPGGVFNRGFVRAYSKFIGIDPESMVDAYLLQENAQGGASSESGQDSSSGRPRWLWWVIGVLGVLVAAAAVYAGWTYWQDKNDTGKPASAVTRSGEEKT